MAMGVRDPVLGGPGPPSRGVSRGVPGTLKIPPPGPPSRGVPACITARLEGDLAVQM